MLKVLNIKESGFHWLATTHVVPLIEIFIINMFAIVKIKKNLIAQLILNLHIFIYFTSRDCLEEVEDNSRFIGSRSSSTKLTRVQV